MLNIQSSFLWRKNTIAKPKTSEHDKQLVSKVLTEEQKLILIQEIDKTFNTYQSAVDKLKRFQPLITQGHIQKAPISLTY